MSILLLGAFTHAENIGWRGDGDGRFPDANPPLTWSETENVIWKMELEDWSNACPIIVADRIFFCQEPDSVICADTTSGKILWKQQLRMEAVFPAEKVALMKEKSQQLNGLEKQKRTARKAQRKLKRKLKKATDKDGIKQEIQEKQEQIKSLDKQINKLAEFAEPRTHNANGFTSPTPISDGERVYFLNGYGIAAAFTLDGKNVWTKHLQSPKHGWGHSSSPIMCGNAVIFSIIDTFAIDGKTGNQLWKADNEARWGTPAKATVDGVELIVSASGKVFRASDGKCLYTLPAKMPYGSPLVHKNIAYFIGQGVGKAFNLTASETKPETLWDNPPKKDRYYASPVCIEGLLYAMARKGNLSVLNASDGSLVYTEKLSFGKRSTTYPSISYAGGKLYIGGDKGIMYVVEPGKEYKQLAVINMEETRTTPFFTGNDVYIRGKKHLYKISSNLEAASVE